MITFRSGDSTASRKIHTISEVRNRMLFNLTMNMVSRNRSSSQDLDEDKNSDCGGQQSKSYVAVAVIHNDIVV